MKKFVETTISLTAFLLAISSAFFCGTARSEEPTGHKKAFLVFVSDYEKYNYKERDALVNDALRLTRLLSARLGYEITLFDTTAAIGEENQQSAPRDSFEKKFNEWIETLQEGDAAFVYLSADGVLDQNGDVHFAFANFNQDEKDGAVNLDKGAYPLATLRDLFDKSAARSKFLVLDCCHAGAIDQDAPLANAKDFVDVFKNADSVTTFASSQGDELSQIWPEKSHSLFTFWLLYGLRGYADDDLNGEITLEELYRYVKQRIKGQTPQLVNESANESLTFNPLPMGLKTTCLDEIAELLACEIKARNPKLKLGVPEFAFGYDDEKIAPEADRFPKQLAKELTKKYKDCASEEGLAGVIDFRLVKEILAENEIEIGRLAARKVAKAFHDGVKIRNDERVALVKGHVTLDCKAAVANLTISCVDLENGEEFGSIKRSALLDDKDIAVLGVTITPSVEVDEKSKETEERLLEAYTADYFEKNGQEPDLDVLQNIEESAGELAMIATSVDDEKTTHPLETDDALCKVSFRTRRYVVNADVNRPYENEGKIAFSGKVARFNLKPGDEFAIVIESTRNQDALVSVTVDGRDTLFDSSEGEGDDRRLGPRRDDYKEYGLWLLRKAEDNRPLIIRGFTRRNEKKYGAFRVVDLKTDESGARTTYGDQTGCIAIYVWEVERGRTLRSKIAYESIRDALPPPVRRGNLRAMYVIRYDNKD